jgi:hypothetical protein
MADDKLAKATDFSSVDLAKVQETMEDIAGETLSPFDLPRIKVPSSGATVWEVPSFEGTEAVKEIDCVILDIRKVRNWHGRERRYATRLQQPGRQVRLR